MGREIYAYCDDDHCDQFTAATCPLKSGGAVGSGPLSDRQRRWGGSTPLESELNRLWRLHGPEDERYCDVTVTLVEPWRSLANMVYGTDEVLPVPVALPVEKAS